MIEIVRDLQLRLAREADDETRRWWERYLKGEARFRGVKMESVRRSVHAWYVDHSLESLLEAGERIRLADRLVRGEFSEDKLAAVVLLHELLIPAGDCGFAELERIGTWFDEGHLSDWNVVDWMCVKALSKLAERDGPATARAILAWHAAPNLWRARASVVSFANTADRGDAFYDGFVEDLLAACSGVIARPERFAKTGVGWVLRTLSTAEPDRVVSFVAMYLDSFSAESIRAALRLVPDRRSGALLARHRAARR